MCRIERYNLIFPDGHSELREQLVNTCRRGTPSSPCHHREYVQVFRDRFATREDNDEYLRRTAPLIEPTRGPTLKEIRKSEKPKSVLQNLGIGFKMWHPFSSERKKRYFFEEPSRRLPNQVIVVEPLPRAPSPPPAWTSWPQEPCCVTAEPRRDCGRPTNRHGEEKKPKEKKPKGKKPKEKKPKRKPAGKSDTVVIHQAKKKPKKSRRKSEVEESDSDSYSDFSPDNGFSSERVRPFQRPRRSPSPVPIIITPNRQLERERKRRREAERLTERTQQIAQAEHDARISAERDAAAERRQQRRIAHQLRLESAERAARRAADEEEQRARDRDIIRRRDMQVEGLIYRQRIRPVDLHHDDQMMGAIGDAFIDRAIANAEANMRRNAVPLPRGGRGDRGGLMRRHTGDGTRGRGYGGYRRGHGYGGSY